MKKMTEEQKVIEVIKRELFHSIRIHVLQIALFQKNFTKFETELTDYTISLQVYLNGLRNEITNACAVDCRKFKIGDRFIIVGRINSFIKGIYFQMMKDFCENIAAYAEAVVYYKLEIHKYSNVVINKVSKLYTKKPSASIFNLFKGI